VITPKHLRMARAGLGWTLADLAKRADVNPNTLSRYEVGKDVLASTVHKVEHVLRAAGVSFIEEHDRIAVSVPEIEKKKP
jgi:transcriptional regulator with XRE-family HTH domain